MVAIQKGQQHSEDISLLIVEDDWVARGFLIDALDDIGRIVACASVAEAEDALMTHPEGFDLVITDIVMPGASGLELLHFVREHLKDDTLPIIVYTSHKEADIEDMAFRAGVTDVIEKPASALAIRRRVRANLQLRQAYQQLMSRGATGEELKRIVLTELKRAAAGRYALGVSVIEANAPQSDRLPNLDTAAEIIYTYLSGVREQEFLPTMRYEDGNIWLFNIAENTASLLAKLRAIVDDLEKLKDDRRMPHQLSFAMGSLVFAEEAIWNSDFAALETLSGDLLDRVGHALQRARKTPDQFVTLVQDIFTG